MGQLLCQVLEAGPEGVLVRILNSDIELTVGVKHDEALGGLIADSEFAMIVYRPANGFTEYAKTVDPPPPDDVPFLRGG